jgi:8-oxo-dGTP pyrophosphatase MutT (NUDIX family)
MTESRFSEIGERPAPAPQAIPAASIVVFRRSRTGAAPELLMLERGSTMRFGAGAAVFPGGRIDPADRELAARLNAAAFDLDDVAARIAAVRETLEEAGLAVAVNRTVTHDEAAAARELLLQQGTLSAVLEQHDWTLDLAAMVPFARWCPHFAGAFDTRFYLADLGTGAVDLAVDATENARLFWTTAADALTMARRKEIGMLFPTERNLERLAQFPDFAAARAEAEATPQHTITPFRELRDGVIYLAIPEGLGYPVTSQLFDTVRRS